MVDIGIIVSGIGIARSLAELMGLIETLEAKIDKLSQSELAAGIRNLDQACLSRVEAESLIREARSCFNKAIGLEAGYRLGIAYLGLALCHAHLYDHENCIRTLRELLGLTPRPSLLREWYAKTQVGVEGESLPEIILENFTPFLIFKDLKRFAVVAARRARYTPDAIRGLVQPSRMEVVLGIKNDSDCYRLARIQLFVSNHLGEAVGWMNKYEVSSKDIGLDVTGVELSEPPNPSGRADS